MRDVVAVEYVTVDGVMEEPAWSNEQFNDELARFQHDQLFASDALLLGRVTFEAFAAVWPSREETEGDFAVRMNALPQVRRVADSERTAGVERNPARRRSRR
jgi:dihydrofolate reductase